jgi:hypothetical protein
LFQTPFFFLPQTVISLICFPVSKKNFQFRDSLDKGFRITNLTQLACRDPAELLRYVSDARIEQLKEMEGTSSLTLPFSSFSLLFLLPATGKSRQLATNILTITITQTNPATENITTSKAVFADLVGSEKKDLSSSASGPSASIASPTTSLITDRKSVV